MRRKTLLVWILCLILLMTCLSCWFLFGRDQHMEKEAPSQTQETASAISDSPAPVSQGEQGTPDPTNNHPQKTEPADTEELSSETELPEIELPVESDKPNAQTESQEFQAESVLTETPESNTQTATPEMPVIQPEETPAQEQKAGNHDVLTNENEAVQFPEVP